MTNATVNEKPQVTTENKAERDYAMVSVSVPLDLQSQLEEQAKASKIAVTVLARRFIAQALNYDVSEFERTRKRGRNPYLTDEEKKANAAAAQRERSEVVRALLEKYRKGEISISDEERQAIAATIKPRKPKAKN